MSGSNVGTVGLVPVKVDAPRMASATTISPKTILATAIPAISTLAAVLIQWAVTGEFDKAELTTAIVGVASSLLSGLGAYLGAPGNVEIPGEVKADVGMAGTVRRIPNV